MNKTCLHISIQAFCLLVVACTACGDESTTIDSSPDAQTDSTFSLSSPLIEDGGELPAELKCESDGGDGASPPLTWTDPPAGTESFAIVMESYPDFSPESPEVKVPNYYWLLWNMPADLRELERGNPDSIGIEGSDKNGGGTGYTPPCAPNPDSVHVYTIRIYALSEEPMLPSMDDVSVDWETLTSAVEDITLATATLDFTN